jgi:oxygen-independent coproporphyrinogen III oxidase
MAGIYIHVPFCKSRCYYCNFFKSTKLEIIEQYLNMVFIELQERRDFFDSGTLINSIYLGGGTPSLLSEKRLNKIFDDILKNYSLEKNAEITIEINPDDITPEYLSSLKDMGVNRLSIGVQSFFDEDLKKMGRRHDAYQARIALDWAFKSGFGNVGIDLIYGLPWTEPERLLKNLKVLNQYPVKHLSAYHLTIEPGTKFGKEKIHNRLLEIDESISEKLFWLLHDETSKMGFDHYEISNFCKDGFYSRHNTSYWTGNPYLGLGPGAHSFDGVHRFWNRPDLFRYISLGYKPGISYEILTIKDRFNEMLMLGLRTKKGVNISCLENNFPKLYENIQPGISKWLNEKFLKIEDNCLKGTRKGWFVIDGIIEDLFEVE